MHFMQSKDYLNDLFNETAIILDNLSVLWYSFKISKAKVNYLLISSVSPAIIIDTTKQSHCSFMAFIYDF